MRCPWLLAPIVVAMSLAGVLIAPQLPDPSPVHWDAAGTPDGFGSPWLSAMLPPALAALTVVGMWWLPRIDRRRTVGAQLTGGECLFMAAIVLFCAALQGITLGSAAGWSLDVARALQLALGGLALALGAALPHVPPNTFVGIRTPWTLADPVVWQRTHGFARWLFAGAGTLLLGLALLVPGATGFVVGVAGMLVAALAAIIASAVIARGREQR